MRVAILVVALAPALALAQASGHLPIVFVASGEGNAWVAVTVRNDSTNLEIDVATSGALNETGFLLLRYDANGQPLSEHYYTKASTRVRVLAEASGSTLVDERLGSGVTGAAGFTTSLSCASCRYHTLLFVVFGHYGPWYAEVKSDDAVVPNATAGEDAWSFTHEEIAATARASVIDNGPLAHAEVGAHVRLVPDSTFVGVFDADGVRTALRLEAEGPNGRFACPCDFLDIVGPGAWRAGEWDFRFDGAGVAGDVRLVGASVTVPGGS